MGKKKSAIHELYGNDEFFFQQDGTLPHYHQDMWAYLNENLQGHWLRWIDAVRFLLCSPDSTPADFYLYGSLNDVMYHKNRLHWQN